MIHACIAKWKPAYMRMLLKPAYRKRLLKPRIHSERNERRQVNRLKWEQGGREEKGLNDVSDDFDPLSLTVSSDLPAGLKGWGGERNTKQSRKKNKPWIMKQCSIKIGKWWLETGNRFPDSKSV